MSEQYISMSRKQYETVQLVSRGYTYEEIAEKLDITAWAVAQRLEACRKRFLCKTQSQLLYRLGIAAGRNLPVSFKRRKSPDA